MVFLGDDRAAFTAAIYAARAGLEPVVFETMEAVEDGNRDGEDDSVRVRDAMRAQARKSGAACFPPEDPVVRVDLSLHPFTVRTKRGVVTSARTLVVSQARAAALSIDVDVDANVAGARDDEETFSRAGVPGVFVARGSGFAAGVAAERWHGPVSRQSESDLVDRGNPIGSAFAETARKVRAAVADASAAPFAREGRCFPDVLPASDEKRVSRGTSASSSSSTREFDSRAVRHVGADAFRRLYAGEGVFEGDFSADDENDATKKNASLFALVAFFAAEGCAPCARVRPMMDSVIDEYDPRRVRFVEMDVEADADVADALGVAGTPSALFYRVAGEAKDGDAAASGALAAERVAAVVGGKTKGAYRDALDEILGEDARVAGPRRRFGG